MSISRKIRRRVRQRGVATVEAAACLPVLVSFFILNVFAMGVIDQKIYVQWTSRGSATYHASAACKKSWPGPGAGAGGGPTAPGNVVANNSGPPGSTLGDVQGRSGTGGINLAVVQGATSHQFSSFSYWGLSRGNITSDSSLLCNEDLYGGPGNNPMVDVVGAIQMIMSFFNFQI